MNLRGGYDGRAGFCQHIDGGIIVNRPVTETGLFDC